MAETTRLVDYYYIQVAQKVGEGAKVLRALKDAGVNLLAFSGFPEGRKAQLDFIPTDAAAFKSAAKANKWKLVGPKRGFLIQGDDRVGVVADIVGKLADARAALRFSTRRALLRRPGRDQSTGHCDRADRRTERVAVYRLDPRSSSARRA